MIAYNPADVTNFAATRFIAMLKKENKIVGAGRTEGSSTAKYERERTITISAWMPRILKQKQTEPFKKFKVDDKF